MRKRRKIRTTQENPQALRAAQREVAVADARLGASAPTRGSLHRTPQGLAPPPPKKRSLAVDG